MRVDRRAVPIGWEQCISAPESPQARRNKALRKEVAPAIRRARDVYLYDNADETGRVQCAATSNTHRITSTEAHVDHAPPNSFYQLVTHWMPPVTVDRCRDHVRE